MRWAEVDWPENRCADGFLLDMFGGQLIATEREEMFTRKSLASALASVTVAGAGVLALTAPAQAAVPGTEQFKNVATSYCLDSNGNGEVYTLGCNTGNYQKWTVTAVSGGYRVQNVATGKCLDSNSAEEVYALACNTGSYQKWAISNNGTGYLLKNVATGKVLDSNSARDVYTRAANGGNYQRWS